jgi:AraC family transcriptional regulator, transcriptional activator of pobA
LPLNTHIKTLTTKELDHHHFGKEIYTQRETQVLFHINKVEDVLKKIKFPIEPHRKTIYDFFYLKTGHSIRGKNLQEYEITKDTFFFLPAYQIATHSYISENSTGYFCHFDPVIFQTIFPEKSFLDKYAFWHNNAHPLISLSEQQQEPVLNILNRLLDEYSKNQFLNLRVISAYLFTLFEELAVPQRQETNVNNTSAFRIAQQYKNLLAKHIYEWNKVAKYAQKLDLSADHLNKCVKTATGKTSQELMADMIILEAKVLLRQTDIKISDIAFKFSEANASDFSRLFRLKTGLSPKEFRNLKS